MTPLGSKGVSKYRGSGRVGSLCFKISRVGSGRVGSGRVGSRGFKVSQVESGRVKKVLISRASGRVMIRDIRVTRGSSRHDPQVVLADSRIKPADLACGIAFFKQLPAGGPLLSRAGAPRAGPADPTSGSERDTKLAASCTKASLVPGRYSDRMLS